MKSMENILKGSHQYVKVLYVEDDKFSREKLLHILNRRFSNVHAATCGEEGFRLYNECHPDVVIADIKMDKTNGLEMIEKIRQQDDKVQIIVITAYEESEFLLQLIENNVNQFIIKPIDLEKLLLAIQRSTAHIELERKVEKQRKLTNVLMDFQDNLIFAIENEQIIEANRAFSAFTGLVPVPETKAEALLGLFVNDSNYFYPRNREDWLEELFKIHHGMAKVKWKGLDEIEHIYFLKGTIIPGEKQYLLVCKDITELENEFQKNELLVTLDPLTKICNRLKFDQILTSEIKCSEQNLRSFSLIMVDIDNFKRVNDQFGHQLGDKVLITLATIVQQRIRENDVFARWEGEKFILLIPDENKQKAAILAESIRKLIAGFYFYDAGKITCSFGITEFSPGKSKSQLLKNLEDAVSMSKMNGKNCTTLHDDQKTSSKAGASVD